MAWVVTPSFPPFHPLPGGDLARWPRAVCLFQDRSAEAQACWKWPSRPHPTPSTDLALSEFLHPAQVTRPTGVAGWMSYAAVRASRRLFPASSLACVSAGSLGRPRRTQWLCQDTKPIRQHRSHWALLNARPLVARTGSWGRGKLSWRTWSISGGVSQKPRGLSGQGCFKEHIQVTEPCKLYVTSSVTGQYRS